MSNSDNLALERQPKFSVAITTAGYRNLINNTLGDPDRAQRFVAAITSAVAVNPALQECEPGSILAAALLGESLNLSPSPQLGQYYLVPYKTRAKYDRKGMLISPEMVKAQFVLGYKGYVQLAVRSGYYKKLNVVEIKQGELVRFDPLREEIVCNLIEDFEEREAAETIGYYAMFEYINGFVKAIYWSKQKMVKHADTYSPAYSAVAHQKLVAGEIPEKDRWKYSSYWYKDFDDMAKKTMLRQLISRWGIMSTELQQAFVKDSTVVDLDDGNELVEIPEEQLVYTQPEATDVVENVDLSEL